MSAPSDNTSLNIDLPMIGTNKKAENKKKSRMTVGSSGITVKGFSLEFGIDHQSTKPFELLEELYKLRSDDTLNRDEKNNRIQKMLETE